MTSNDCCENTAVTCECKAEEIIFLPCSGGSNCGQITNHVAVKLDKEGVGRIYCLAGIGAHVDGMVETARGVEKNHQFKLAPEEIDLIAQCTRESLAKPLRVGQ